MKKTILRAERGFTLVELGIVMAIIAILAAVAYPTYKGMTERAKLSEAKSLLQEIRVNLWADLVERGVDKDFATALKSDWTPASTNWSFTLTTSGAPISGGYVCGIQAREGTGGTGTVKTTLWLSKTGTATFVP